MRRIPCPQRAIDRSLPILNSSRHQSPYSLCRRTPSLYPLLRTTHASFSTTPNLSFILGKNDPKKHQQLVRRWQKRLLGESEPIGAHVDPFDATSPVRIAPEEQGEELEVLADEGSNREMDTIYEEELDGSRLRHVGGEKWVDQLEESKLAKEYEKLTMRTYTPLTLAMAEQLEDLTGTMYSLRDNNLAMADDFYMFSNKPYSKWSFGRSTPIRDLPGIHSNFHRAVVEIYSRKLRHKPLDITALRNRGIYDAPPWIADIKLQKKKKGDITLAFPKRQSFTSFNQLIRSIPKWQAEKEVLKDNDLVVEEENLAGEENPIAEEPAPQMDPDTPAFKREAVVVQDPDKKPFDFMSNRPVPRSPPTPPPQNPIVDTAADTNKPVSVDADATPSTANANTESIGSDGPAEKVATPKPANDDAASATKKNDSIKTKAKAQANVEVKWRDVPLTDVDFKFALMKRINQLTGLYISDPALTSVKTLGELYQHVCAAAKPKPKNLYSQLHIVGQHQAEIAKKSKSAAAPETKSNLSTLLKLRNVEILRKKPNAKELRTKKGLNKVIAKELRKGPLGVGPVRLDRKATREEKSYLKRETMPIEGTRIAPDLGVPVTPTAAQILKDRTERKKRDWFESHDKSWNEVDMLIRERKFASRQSDTRRL